MGYWGVVLNVLKNSDIILLIVDSRVVGLSRNISIESQADQLHKELIYVFNKTDLISKDIKEELQETHPNAFFVSAKNRKGIKELRKYLDKRGLNREKSLRISLVGYPNVGKSSVLNLLVPEARAKTSTVSGTTKSTQWIRSRHLRFMDSPGVIPTSDRKINLGITASKDIHKIPDPEKVALRLIEVIRSKKENLLFNFYGVAKQKELTDYDLFLEIGKAKKYLIKGGEVNENRTAIKIVEDWQKGKLGLK